VKGIVREPARAAESITPPSLRVKTGSGDGAVDGDRSLGQAVGAQGALIQPGWIRGCEQTLVSPSSHVGDHTCGKNVERLIRRSGAARQKRDGQQRCVRAS